jgi:hypothetical protein
LIVWARLSTFSEVCWSCVAAAYIRAPLECIIHGISIAWTEILGEEYLTLTTLLCSTSSETVNESSKLMVSIIGQSQLLSGKVSETILRNTSFYPILLSRANDTLNGSVCIEKLSPSLFTDCNFHSDDRFGLFIWIGNRLYCFEVIVYESLKLYYALCWTDVSKSDQTCEHSPDT